MPLRPRHLLLSLALATPASAGIRTDGSVGPRKILSGPDFSISNTLGQQRGQNLFHSFQRFNLKNSQSATFTGPPEVRNIFARVTGGSPSKIKGALRSDISGANLFLLNPSGILFGDGASLDLTASFTASTAARAEFSGSGLFPSDPNQIAVLTSGPITSFGFLANSAAPITVQNTTLRVQNRQSLSLISTGATIRRATLSAPGGSLAVASGKTVNVSRPIPQTTSPFGLIDITNDSALTTESPNASAGPITLAADSLRLRRSFIVAQSFGPDPAGDIRIHAPASLFVRGAFIAAGAFASGDSADIRLSTGLLRLSGAGFDQPIAQPGGIINQTGESGGRAGDIRVHADQIQLRRLGQIISTTLGPQTAGNVSVTADQISITDGGFIGARTFADGDAGDVLVRSNRLAIAGRGTLDTGIFSDTLRGVSGSGGDLSIHASTLRVLDFGRISTSTTGSGDGGNLTIRAANVLLDGGDFTEFTGLAANTQARKNAGRGGSIRLHADSLTILDGAGIAARSRGTGRPGDIHLDVAKNVLFDGRATGRLPGLTTETASLPADGGNITLRAGGNISLHAAEITAKTSRDDANITINSSGNLVLADQSRLTAQAGRDGGRIDIHSDFVILRDASLINGTAGGIDVLVSIAASSLLLDIHSAILTDRPSFNIDDTIGRTIAGLRVNLADANLRLSEVCARAVESTSTFIATGRGATPLSPGGSTPATDLKLE